MSKWIDVMWCYVYSLLYYLHDLGVQDDVICICVMIMLVLRVVYMDNDDKYPWSMTSTHMNPIWMCDESMLGVLYSIVKDVLSSYYVMWMCVVRSPRYSICLNDFILEEFCTCVVVFRGWFPQYYMIDIMWSYWPVYTHTLHAYL